MFFTGFADEAGADLATQIAATKELGWKYIESRRIGDKMLGTMSDEEFAKVEEMLSESGVSINCYGSAVANWQCHPRSDEDYQRTKTELLTAIPRMQKLGIKMLRGMSFLVPEDEPAGSPGLEKVAYTKVKELVQICADNGIIYGHENCMNLGGMSWQHTLSLLEFVDSPALKLIYDTGNPCFIIRRIGLPEYWTLQSSWEYYHQVRDHIAYVHIKDGTAYLNPETRKADEMQFTWAGDGNGDVRAIVTDLRKRGYDGGFSMEPHLASVYHDLSGKDSSSRAMTPKEVYVEYGRRFMKLLKECGWEF